MDLPTGGQSDQKFLDSWKRATTLIPTIRRVELPPGVTPAYRGELRYTVFGDIGVWDQYTDRVQAFPAVTSRSFSTPCTEDPSR
ncbi:hypothetical protein ACGFMK_26135 [Amycolatopsis sp. NPDC049252]|uniref:hypothetical protein n=1 Tax=Amycolatopsis sp. NPDC049252 TaxID=3363933 RepID=UPI00371A5E46